MFDLQRLNDLLGTKVKITEVSHAGTVVTYVGVLTKVEEFRPSYLWIDLNNEWTLEFELSAASWTVEPADVE